MERVSLTMLDREVQQVEGTRYCRLKFIPEL